MPSNQDNVNKVTDKLKDMNRDELTQVRNFVDNQIVGYTDTKVGSADASADNEKRKEIAQNGSNPLKQETAQAVPEPQSDEVKDLQNDMAEREHQAKGASGEDEKEGRLNAAGART